MSLRISSADRELIKSKARKAGVSQNQYVIDRIHSTKESIIPEINQEVIILLRAIAQRIREENMSAPEIHAILIAIQQIALGRQ